MNVPTDSFFNAVLRTIACTPNRNSHDRDSREAIVSATNRIRAIEKNLDDNPQLNMPTAHEVLTLLAEILTEKNAPPEDWVHYATLIRSATGIDSLTLSPMEQEHEHVA